MEIKPLKLAGTFEISIKKHGDARGYFMETYKKDLFAEYNLQTVWTQENQSLSEKKHTLKTNTFLVLRQNVFIFEIN